MFKQFIAILSVLLLAVVLQVSGQTDSSKKGCADASCHGNLIANDVVHDAIKRGCEKCHQSNGQEHPTKDGTKNFSLTKQIPQLCYTCHDENNTGTHVHPPVAKGECLDCHTPHSSPEGNLLKKYPTAQVCFQCHKLESAQKKYKHDPVEKGTCEKCHDPHNSEFPKFLVKEPPALCLKCHSKQADESKMDHVHPPFAKNCLNCHNQHSSDQPKLLDLTPPKLCFYCHDDMQRKIEKATTVHGAVSDQRSCLNCHSPHASAQNKFLLADPTTLCLSCHNKTMLVGTRKIANIDQTIKKAKSVHQAIDKYGCIGCHDPHASQNQFLLLKPMPIGSYAPASKESFALCFKCHNSDLIDNKTTVSATNFRNGDKNLHFVHINGDKGRSCKICHNPHGSVNDHLINETAPFGSWEMPLNYKVLDNGGSCSPGCHEERKYERVIAK